MAAAVLGSFKVHYTATRELHAHEVGLSFY
jgi:hypothetical protein